MSKTKSIVNLLLPLVAVLLIVPAVNGAVSAMFIVALLPDIMSPIKQVTVPAASLQLPCVVLADWKRTPVGRVSVTVTPVASSGPLFVTTSM